MEPLLDEGTKVYSNGPGHMTKMATMPIYGKNLLLGNQTVNDLETLHAASSARVLLGLFKWTLTYFTARSTLVPYCFVWEKGKTIFQKLLSYMI